MMTALLLVAPWAGVAVAQDTTRAQTQSQYGDTLNKQQLNNDDRSMPQSDEAIVMRLHQTNQLEIKVGQLAQRNSSSAKVKQFGSRLVRDHQAADQKVTALAKKLGITLARVEPYDRGAQGQGQGREQYGQRDTTKRSAQRDTTNPYGQPEAQRADTTGNMERMYGHDQMQGKEKNPEQELQRLAELRGAAFDTAFANAMVEGHQKAISMLESAQNQVQSADLRTFITNTLPTLRQHLQVAQSLQTSISSTSSSSQQQ